LFREEKGIKFALLFEKSKKGKLKKRVRVSKRHFISFLNYKNRDFDEKQPPTCSSIRYPNIDIFYFGFLAS
jgi:hypothetical protein